MLTGLFLAAWLSLSAVDVQQSCTHHLPTYREVNPLVFESCKYMIPEVIGADGLAVWIVQKHIHGKWKRRIIYGALAGMEAAVVYHNAKVFRSVERK